MSNPAIDPADAAIDAPPFRIAIIPVTAFQQNCSLVWEVASGRAAVVDPGGDVDRILRVIAEAKVTVEKILLTHGHVDHIGGVTELRDRLQTLSGVPVTVEGPHRDDSSLMDQLVETARKYGLVGVQPMTTDRWLVEGDTVAVGDVSFEVLHCPGHSPGSVVFFNRGAGFAIVGDVIFKQSVGRTDLPGGNHDQLIASIRDKLLPLGDDVAFLPGHGDVSDLGSERASNPFLVGI
jgi:glyoxylase-like metal-dependent hydrolase (beta-lactamase superfamily II)